MKRIHVCTGLLVRDGCVLLVANAYPNRSSLLWSLPGGRQEWNETAPMTVVREVREETGLVARVGAFAYLAESFDHTTDTQVTAMCFCIDAEGIPATPTADDHVRDCRFVPLAELASVLDVRVIREPLLGHLASGGRYFGYQDAGITIAFAGETAVGAAIPPDADGRARRRHDGRE